MTETADKVKASLPRITIEAVPSSPQAAKLLDDLGAAVDSLFAEANVAVINGAVGAARAFVILHRMNAKLELFCKAFEERYKAYKTERIPAAIERSGQDFIPLTEGFRVGVSHKLYASIREGQKDAAYHWLRANKLGDLIVSTVNASTLSAAVKHMRENDNREPPAELFNVAIVPNTSVTQTKK